MLYPLSERPQDTIGILTRSVLDSAMVLDVIAGPDARDSTCVQSGAAGWPLAGDSCEGDGRSGGLARALLDAGDGGSAAGTLDGVTVGIPIEFNVDGLREYFVRMAPDRAASCSRMEGVV